MMLRHKHLRLPAWVGPAGHGIVWSRSHTVAGRSHPGARHVRSRARTNSANPREGRYPASAPDVVKSDSGRCLACGPTRPPSAPRSSVSPHQIPGLLRAALHGGLLGHHMDHHRSVRRALPGRALRAPQRHANRSNPTAIAPSASARRCSTVRGSSGHTVAASASRRASSAAASVLANNPDSSEVPLPLSHTLTRRSRHLFPRPAHRIAVMTPSRPGRSRWPACPASSTASAPPAPPTHHPPPPSPPHR